MKDIKMYLNKKELEKVKSIELDSDLIDGCKYMLYLKQDYCLYKGETSYPCKSIKEIKYFIKNYTY